MEKIFIVKGNIVKSKTDAIVNAANTSLLGGGGVDGAIHKAAGPELLEECSKLNGCERGEAKITSGYKLKAKHIIHTSGPIWRGGTWGEADTLAQCYQNCLKVAAANGVKTIAFPAISTGVYKFPVDQAAKIALVEIRKFLEENDAIEEVYIYCFDDRALKIYKDTIDEINQEQ